MSLQTVRRLLRVALPTLALTLVEATVGAQSPALKTVLTVHWGSESYPANPVMDAAIREGLLPGFDAAIDYRAEYLESGDLPEKDASLALRDYIRRKYQRRRIDLVVATNDVALEFALRFRRELFPDAPIVYRGAAAADAAVRDAGPGLTGVLVGTGLKETLELALELHPPVERVVVVAGAPNIRLQDSMRRELGAVAHGTEIRYITEESLPRLIAAIKAVPARSAILYARDSQEERGHVLVPSEVARMVSDASQVPAYGISDSYLGSGVVGGAMYEARAVGNRMGEMARQILDGRRAQDIPLERARLVPTFDWRQVRRWGISERQLPAGSRILYRGPGAWEQYRVRILAGTLLMLLQSALIASLLIQRTRRARVERTLREREERSSLDIADRQESEDALRRNQQRYTMATAAGAVGVWDWNFETNEIYVDPTLKAILGFADAEITNSVEDWGSRVHPEDAPAATARVRACIDGKTDVYEIEHRMLHKDGSSKWFLSRGSAVRGIDGTLQRLVGTKVDITERKRAEDAVHENEAALQASNREIRHLAGSLITAQDAERARIARDLHDDVSQQVAALSIALSSLKRRVAAVSNDAHLDADVSSIQQRTTALAESVRALSHDLHPDVLRHAGLAAALAAHSAGLSHAEAIDVTCTVEGDCGAIDAKTAVCLYRIAQEALHNVVKHSGARHAEVQLLCAGDRTQLTIVDDGRGFDVAKTWLSRKGLGLVSIKERARLAGGTLSVATELDKGTRVRVRLPTTPGPRPAPDDVA